MSREEGIALAEELGCLFFECSAKTRENVERCFEELALKVRFLKVYFYGVCFHVYKTILQLTEGS